MYKSVFSMLIAAKAAEIKSNPTRTEILSEEQWLRKLIDGKKPMEWPCYNSWRPTFFRRNEDSDKLWAEDNQFQRPQFTPFQPLLRGEDSSNVAVPTNLVPGFLEGWYETIEKDKPDNVSRDTFLRAREFHQLFGSHWFEINPKSTLGHHFSKMHLKKYLKSEQRPVTVEVVRGGWKKLVYGNGDEEWDPV